MKLYMFRPEGHGEYTFVVAAETLEEAMEAVDRKVEEVKQKDSYAVHWWRKDKGTTTVVEPGVALLHEND